MVINLKDNTAIVTGASRGIGRVVVQTLAAAGANVVMVSRNNDDLKRVADEISSTEGRLHCVAADISRAEDWSNILEQTLNKFQGVQILVNNAGITRDNLILRMKEQDWQQVLDINLSGAFWGIKAVTRPMVKSRQGRIINITSVVGQIGNAGQCNYAASKAGIIGLTKSAAKELASRNITVNAIAPGYIATDMTNELSTEVQQQLLEGIPLGRLGRPADIAGMVAFLASSQADYITGQTFNVDGGMVML